jgi:hypothetical protein
MNLKGGHHRVMTTGKQRKVSLATGGTPPSVENLKRAFKGLEAERAKRLKINIKETKK